MKEKFNNFANFIAEVVGRASASLIAIFFIVVWLITGPFFSFSDTWQLVMNTTSSIITFLMVFVIQHTENKDMIALQVKLDALIEKSNVSDKMINVEELSDEQLEEIKNFYIKKQERESQQEKKSDFSAEGKEVGTNILEEKKQLVKNKNNL